LENVAWLGKNTGSPCRPTRKPCYRRENRAMPL